MVFQPYSIRKGQHNASKKNRSSIFRSPNADNSGEKPSRFLTKVFAVTVVDRLLPVLMLKTLMTHDLGEVQRFCCTSALENEASQILLDEEIKFRG